MADIKRNFILIIAIRIRTYTPQWSYPRMFLTDIHPFHSPFNLSPTIFASANYLSFWRTTHVPSSFPMYYDLFLTVASPHHMTMTIPSPATQTFAQKNAQFDWDTGSDVPDDDNDQPSECMSDADDMSVELQPQPQARPLRPSTSSTCPCQGRANSQLKVTGWALC
ncbi:hypothetical protein BJV74DRAFT_841605 [Russula compacta]|nr:hypothetical protein BJV74DRAFT_841605 [Russula compacta]